MDCILARKLSADAEGRIYSFLCVFDQQQEPVDKQQEPILQARGIHHSD